MKHILNDREQSWHMIGVLYDSAAEVQIVIGVQDWISCRQHRLFIFEISSKFQLSCITPSLLSLFLDDRVLCLSTSFCFGCFEIFLKMKVRSLNELSRIEEELDYAVS